MKNVIILGPGRTGSSLLSGLISHNRFYIQKEEIHNRMGYPDGDYELPELIQLNKDIFLESGYRYNKIRPDSKVDTRAIENIIKDSKNIEKYNIFVEKCEQNSPWLWKDPRLCYTIFFWKHLIDFKNINIIFVTRDRFQVFKSYAKYKTVYTKREVYKKYDEQILAVEEFLLNNKLDALRINYDEFKDKQKLIRKLNNFLGTGIKLMDFDEIQKTNIKKKESDLKFRLRYSLGFIKLKIDNLFSKERFKEDEQI